MAERRDFKAVSEIRGLLNTANDDALVNLSSKALSHVKNILKLKEKTGQTAAYHNIAPKLEKLNTSMEKINESMQFLSESQGTIKNDWQVLKTSDAKRVREALFALLSSCEALDGEDIAGRIKKESQAIDKIKKRMDKIKNSDQKSAVSFEKQSLEFVQSLVNLDNIIGGTSYPADEFEVYSKFSEGLENLVEQLRRLNESLRFFKDEHTKEDWEYFMKKDLERLKESIETSHISCEKFISASGVAKGTQEIKYEG